MRQLALLLTPLALLACNQRGPLKTDSASGAVSTETSPAAPASGVRAADSTSASPAADVAAVGTYGEDLYDQARASNWTNANALLDSLDRAAKALPTNDPRLSAETRRLIPVIDSLRQAVSQKQRTAAMKAANRVTFLSAKMTDAFQPVTPVQVLLLDYYGRELEIWSAEQNAAKLAQVSVDIQDTWKALRPSVEKHQGAVAMQHTDSLVSRIRAAKAPSQYAKLATPFLDEVDELEKVFTKQ